MAELAFDGAVAIVTGSGGGLGRDHALLLASRGASVVVNDLGGGIDGTGSDKGAAERVVDEIRAAGGEAIADTSSVASPDGGRRIVQTAIDTYGRIDIVVNNAGILRDKAFHNMDSSQVDAVLDVHLRGAFNVTQPAWVWMRQGGYGRIVLTSSASGIFGNYGQANYAAAKMGIIGLTRVLAIEGAKHNIKVNAIAPVALTRMSEMSLGPRAESFRSAKVSSLVALLAHRDCPTTGETFSAGGGRVTNVFVGQTEGYISEDLTPEAILGNWDAVVDRAGYTVPKSIADERVLLDLVNRSD